MSLKTLTVFTVLAILLLSSYSASPLGNLQARQTPKITEFSSIQISNNTSNETSYELRTLDNFLAAFEYTSGYNDIMVFGNQTKLESNGLVTSVCFYNDSSNSDPSTLFCELVFLNMDQNFQESLLVINLYLNESNQTNFKSGDSLIVYKGVPSNMAFYSDTSNISQSAYCQTDATYAFINANTMKPFNATQDSASSLSVAVSLSGGNCGYDISTPLMTSGEPQSEDENQVIPYVGVMVAFGFLHALSCERLIKGVERDPRIVRRTSIGSVCLLLTFDFYLYLIHFRAWVDNSDWLAAVFIVFFLVSVFCEPALLYYVFKSTQNRRDRPNLDIFYDLYFWILIGGTCLVLALTYIPSCLIYACPFFLLPQVWDNFNSEKKYRWNWWLLLGLGLPKLIFVAYATCFPGNPINSTLNPMIAIIVGSTALLLLIILAVQTKLPKLGFKLKATSTYSYICDSKDIELISTEVCSICTEAVVEAPLIGNTTDSLLAKPEASNIMKTPCNHYYHAECLKEWIIKKLECPNCRQTVPPIEDDEL